MSAPKPKQIMPVVCPTPPIPATVALRRLEIAYNKKTKELDGANIRINILLQQLKIAKADK